VRGRRRSSFGRALTWVGTAGATALTAHTALNLRALRVPPVDPPAVAERISVLVPARDEEHRIAGCLATLLDQVGVADLEVLVLDDGSADRTAAIVADLAERDPRLRLLPGASLPPGWLGKPHACHQLAEAATGRVLVFVDADVRLAPHALAATVAVLREHRLDLVCPYPRQLARTPAERLVQPLLQWSWLTTLPLRLAERSPRPSLSAANGQLLAVDAASYRRAGGHRAVRAEVIEDLALLRAVKRVGGRGGVVDGTGLATCRMYHGWDELKDGYSKSLWAAFPSPAAAAGAVGLLGLCYVVPAAAALRGSAVGAAGYLAGVTGRYLVAERTGGRSLPDSLVHPASITMLGWLTARSWRLHRRGELRWKGRLLAGTDRGPAGS
jgi:Glycosyl transferase family 2